MYFIKESTLLVLDLFLSFLKFILFFFPFFHCFCCLVISNTEQAWDFWISKMQAAHLFQSGHLEEVCIFRIMKTLTILV